MKNIAVFLFLFFTFIFGATSSYACSCISDSPSNSIKSADVVLIGKVAKELKQGEKWQVKANRVLKGKVGETVILYAAMKGTSCEVSDFKLAETYIFYLNKIDTDDLATDENAKIIEAEKSKVGGFEPIVCSWSSLLSAWKTDEYKKVLIDYKDKKFLKILNQETKQKGRKLKTKGK